MCVSSVACSYYFWMSRQPADRLIMNGGMAFQLGLLLLEVGVSYSLSSIPQCAKINKPITKVIQEISDINFIRGLLLEFKLKKILFEGIPLKKKKRSSVVDKSKK